MVGVVPGTVGGGCVECPPNAESPSTDEIPLPVECYLVGFVFEGGLSRLVVGVVSCRFCFAWLFRFCSFWSANRFDVLTLP